jgi:glycosyltransferase involved in cell wall biosynthesis
MTKLSILIPTLNEPESIRYLARLRSILDPQIAKYPGQVEIRIHDAGRAMPTGTKRNQLIANSDGEFFVFIDCDDWVPGYYLDEIMKALEYSPDVVNFKGWMTTNGADRRNFIIRLHSKYEESNGVYYRWSNHLSVMRRSCVERVKFPDIWLQEDYQWSKVIHDKKLLRTEFFIDKDMYHYMFSSHKPAYNGTRKRR